MNNTENEYFTPKKFSQISFPSGSCSINSSKFDPEFSKNCGTPNSSSLSKRTTRSFHLMPFINTPPSRLKKVINPFEHALMDRLHLPLICSPSLFKPPTTPKNASLSSFEWTIEDVSSLKPANVEPHETQFEFSPNPEFEAKAQAAIRSYFKENLVVPSPSDCSIRENRKMTLLEELSTSSTLSLTSLKNQEDKLIKKPLKRSRNMITQTMLSFPPNLPTEIEAILEKYLIVNENKSNLFKEDLKTGSDSNNLTVDYESREVSRRLFDSSMHSDQREENDVIKTPEKGLMLLHENLNPPLIKTPDLDNQPLTAKDSGNMCGNTSFGAISPIFKSGSSFHSNKSSRLNNTNFPKQQDEESDIFENTSLLKNSVYKSAHNDFTSSPIMNMSVDVSFNAQRLNTQQNSHKSNRNRLVMKSKSISEADILNQLDADQMQVSQLTFDSFDSGSGLSASPQHHTDTPIKRRRHLSRKNLSRSFSFHLADNNNSDSDSENDNNLTDFNYNAENIVDKNINQNKYYNHDHYNAVYSENKNKIEILSSTSSFVPINDAAINKFNFAEISKIGKMLSSVSTIVAENEKSSIFQRTDSGFNEMTTTQDESKFTADLNIRCGLDKDKSLSNLSTDISMTEATNNSLMRCCSTPSKKIDLL